MKATCNKCGYHWEFNGKRYVAMCPKCKKETRIRDTNEIERKKMRIAGLKNYYNHRGEILKKMKEKRKQRPKKNMVTLKRTFGKDGRFTGVIYPDVNISPTKDWGYLFGIVLGDGCAYKNSIWVSSSKTEIVNAFTNIAKKLGFNPRRYQVKRKEKRFDRRRTDWIQYSSVIFNKNLYDEFILYKLEDYKFDIPKFVYKNKETIAGFLQGFFDAEGSIDLSSRKICAASKHNESLEKIQDLLKLLNIESKIHVRHTRFCSELGIYKNIEVAKFKKYIGFRLERKRQRLEKIFAYPNQPSKATYEFNKHLYNQGFSYGYISDKVNVAKSTVYKWMVENKIPWNVKYEAIYDTI